MDIDEAIDWLWYMEIKEETETYFMGGLSVTQTNADDGSSSKKSDEKRDIGWIYLKQTID